ncbi:hypothetical protein HYS54_00370 [Candidatus Micrarchaeota archaeon]|nr:hypothetical protein [Candidatus Micrarchaeota archaeon]
MAEEENITRIESLVRNLGLDARVIRHAGARIISHADHVARFGDIPNLKCLAFVSRGQTVVVCALGGTRIDGKKLTAETGLKKPRLANAEELASLFGASPGGVCCLLVPKNIPLLLDKRLLEKERALGSAGSPEAGLEIAPREILRVTHARVADVCE